MDIFYKKYFHPSGGGTKVFPHGGNLSLSFYALIFLSAFLLSSCSGSSKKANEEYINERGMVWNTTFNITYQSSRNLGDSIRKVLDEVGHNLSVFDTTSLVSRVNRQDSTLVNTDFIRVYIMSRKINRLSGGLFDPTVSPLVTAWGFGPGHKATADTLRLDSLLRIVGIEKTHLKYDSIIKDTPYIQFNFSAIAKGYGVDRVAEALKKEGVNNFLVEIGGEIRAAGKSPRGTAWNISVDRPIMSNSAVIHESQLVIAFTNMGMATSGNYRNYKETKSGERYGHTISPLTGRPIKTDILSATVLARSSMEADGLATAFMAMGREKTMELNRKLKLPILLVCSDTVWISPQFEGLIVK